MTEQTFTRKLEQFVTILTIHPHREELIRLMQEQVSDDTYKVSNNTYSEGAVNYC